MMFRAGGIKREITKQICPVIIYCQALRLKYKVPGSRE